MKSEKPKDKSQAILAALANGCCCDQILAADPALTYHDIFRAVADLPENQRNWLWSRAKREGWQHQPKANWRLPKDEPLSKVRD